MPMNAETESYKLKTEQFRQQETYGNYLDHKINGFCGLLEPWDAMYDVHGHASQWWRRIEEARDAVRETQRERRGKQS